MSRAEVIKSITWKEVLRYWARHAVVQREVRGERAEAVVAVAVVPAAQHLARVAPQAWKEPVEQTRTAGPVAWPLWESG